MTPTTSHQETTHETSQTPQASFQNSEYIFMVMGHACHTFQNPLLFNCRYERLEDVAKQWKILKRQFGDYLPIFIQETSPSGRVRTIHDPELELKARRRQHMTQTNRFGQTLRSSMAKFFSKQKPQLAS